MNSGRNHPSGSLLHPVSKTFRFLCGVVIGLSLVGITTAAPPVNDNFANRTLIPSIPATVSGNTTNSTSEVGDPMTSRSIWWKFTAQESGTYTLSASPFYTNVGRLHLYTGNSLGTLVKVSGQMVAGAPTYTWAEKFQLTAGVEYSILIGSTADWDVEAYTLSVTRNVFPTVSITNPVATTPYFAGRNLELQVNASDPDGNIARVDYYFDLDSTPIASSTVPPFSATITLPSVGIRYQHVWATATDNNGAKTVSSPVVFLLTQYTSNDLFADRKQVTGDRVFETSDLQYASVEAGEPVSGSRSIWWSWTAPSSKAFVISSHGWPGGFSPRLEIYTGSSLNSLTDVGSHIAGGGITPYTAQVTLNATAGQTYAIRVTSAEGMGGETSLSVVPQAAPGTPPQVESLRFTEDGKIEFMLLTNSAPLSEFQSSPNLKDWTPVISSSPFPANGYFREVIPRPADKSYFYRLTEKVPPP